MAHKIFISYRREDSGWSTQALYSELRSIFGDEEVFMDRDDIHGGDDFANTIENALNQCDALIAVIGPQWLTAMKNGTRRLDDPNDYVVWEISTALQRGIRVIPALVDGTPIPAAGDLPEKLKSLIDRHAISLQRQSFKSEVAELVETLQSTLGLIPAVDKAKEALIAELRKKDIELQQEKEQRVALTAAVNALAQRTVEPDAPLGIKEALAKLGEGDSESAEAIFQQVAETNVAAGSEAEATAARANAKAAEAYRHIGSLAFLHDTEKAHNAYRRATELDPDNPEGWNQRGHLEKRIGDLLAAVKAYREVLHLAENNNNMVGVATAYGNLGTVYTTAGDLEQAEALHKKALALNEEVGNKEGAADNYGNLGNIYRVKNCLDDAEAMYRKTLAHFEELGRIESTASAYGNLGTVFLLRGDLEQAEALYRLSLDIEETLGRKVGMSNAYGNLGIVYSERGDLEQAEDMYRQSLSLDEELKNKEGVIIQLSNLGIVYMKKGDLVQAETLYKKALALNEALGAKEAMANAYANLGLVYSKRDDQEQAEAMWKKSLEIFQKLGSMSKVEQIQSLLDDQQKRKDEG